MQLEQPLFEGERICLGPIDFDKDPEIESRWTHDPYYLRMLSAEPARPLAPSQVKKKYEAIEKEQDEKRSSFYFAIRAKTDDRLMGFVQLFWIEWSNGIARIKLGIGAGDDRGCGYGSEALRLALRFAFAELNLYRLTAVIPEYNTVALHVFSKAGFVEEVRRREAVYRDGRRWDIIHLGILQDEWRP
jgi:RimJ/RimL family protein N-acetyltransferase